ncbi:ThuA domain-containing protein [Aquipuribacter sp. MA13-6]|uniref:ThuA domain-containing protein n=1 Tax=unclassified Aquipuribacter TaxID=2635084 RepID=UPI003EEB2557
MHVPRPRRTRVGGLVATGLAALLAATTVAAAPAAAVVEEEAAEANVLIFTKTTQFRHTEAIVQGTPVLQAAFAEAGIDSVHTEDSTIFNDTDLATFDALVMFQTSGDPWNAEEKAALERYQQAGGGIVAIHNATDMRGNYAWWDEMIGALMPGHAATGNSPGLPGTVRVEDRTHPSTEHLPQRWDRADEWYNYSANVRGEAHVLATMDESTYAPGPNAMGADHPISWCRGYDGGRSWMTGMGHFGAHFTGEPDLVQHILGGVEWAAGLAEGDCGGTDWSEFEKVSLDSNTSAPFAMDVAPDGRVFFTELVRGQIRVYDPARQVTSTAVTLPVYSGGEDGLLGIALDPDFATNGHLFVYYSPASADDRDPANFFSQVSRFTVEEGSVIDPASEVVVMEVPARRLPDEPGHTGGALAFDNDGNLLLGVGDDVNPHSEPSGGYAPLSERTGTFHDARETSANTNDLRGKLLRITPQDDGSYTVPDGNLIDSAWAEGKDRSKIKPEVYAMGFRNPFRFSVDPVTGHIGLADYSPDNSSDNPTNRGPAGIAEWNLITEPGNYGWPMCMGDNEPFRDVDYRTSPVTVGPYFDCDAPVNDSVRNTGLTELPPAVPADLYYGYQRTSAPGIINAGGGLAPMGGPFYDFDAELDSDTKFPESYSGKPFFYDWARNRMFSVQLTDAARAGEAAPGDAVEQVTPFLPPPAASFMAPIDSTFGPDGSLYVLDWGGGYGRDNPDSGLHRIDYISGSRSPEARITTDVDSGPAPLTVAFSGETSSDPEGGDITYAWDFDGDGTVDSTESAPTHTYTADGVYDARLTVTDPEGKTGTATAPITVGNTRPVVEFVDPPTGGFFDFGDPIDWDLEVSDAEDEEIDESKVIIQPALGHDDHAHPAAPRTGTTGTLVTELGGGHGEDMDVFYVVDGRYTDDGGAEGVPALTGSDTSLIYPRLKEAEFHASTSEDLTTSASGDIEGHGTAIGGSDGAWASYDPVNLRGVDAFTVRAASAAGGTVELRRDAPDGDLLATAEVPATGSLSRYVDVRVPVTDPGDSFELFLVMTGFSTTRVNFIEAMGKALSPAAPAEVRLTQPEPWSVLDPGTVELAAEASVAEGSIAQVEFLVDGEVVATDTTAPFTGEWDVTEERRYQLSAVATTGDGEEVTSRRVVVDVGDLLAGWETWTHPNAAATFDRPDSDTWVVTSGGANMWQATDEYGTAFRPGGAAGEQWTATVRVDSATGGNTNAKAGLLVRNDATAPGTSPGYGAVGLRPNNGVEWLRDSDGNGTLNASTAGGTNGYPTWVRLVRDGASYQASSSRDGVTFTPLGGPVQLPGAADVQDIGLFVTAHSTTARMQVQFSDFTLVEGGPEPEPEPEPLPPCVGTNGDTFDGDALDTDRWTTVRQADGLPVSVSGGALRLPVPQGDIDGGSTGPISFVGQPAAAGAWEATTTLTLPHTRHWQHAGLMLNATDDEYVKLAYTRSSNGSRFLEFVTETGGARTWHHNNVAMPTGTDTVWLRLTSDGEGLRAAYSLDGGTWTDLDGVAPLKADAVLGLVAAGDTGTSEAVAAFDSFQLTVPDEGDPLEPSDEFEGTALDTCRWDAVVRPDGNALQVTDGHLSITTQPGDINGAANEDPRNFVLQDLGDGDWTVETRLRATMKHQWQLAGLMAYGDDDNYVKLDIVANNAPTAATNLGAELVSERNGVFGNGGNRGLDIAETSESGYFYLRLTKEGSTYSGWVSDGGVTWTSLGAPVTNDAALTNVGVIAIGPAQVEPVVVDFDFFRVTTDDEEPDTTAPELDVTVSPAEPDGLEGWWTSPVTVSATATDDSEGDVLVEHRVGDGGWTEHTEPVVVAEDGTHVVHVRATDEAGNVATHEPLTVQLDTTAPVVDVAGVSDGAEVEQGETVDLAATATDATSGVASLEVVVDGEAVDAETSWVPSRGTHTVEVTATDVAGHVTTGSVTFTVLVTFAGISGELDAMHADGDLSRAQHSRLDAQVVAAERAHARDDAVGVGRALDRFEDQVATVRDAAVRAALTEMAEELRARFA